MLGRSKKSEKGLPLGKSYWRLWSAHAISNLGDGVTAIAYPWLASAVTRSPFLIALIAVASRLPWLIFTLPAGVITDRYDRKKIIVSMDATRGILALIVGVFVTLEASQIGDLNKVAQNANTQTQTSFLNNKLLLRKFNID